MASTKFHSKKRPHSARDSPCGAPAGSQQREGVAAEVALSDEDSKQALQHFLEERHLAEIERILLADDASLYYALHVDMGELLDFNPQVAHLLHARPRDTLPLFDDAICSAQDAMCQSRGQCGSLIVKSKVRARLHLDGSPLACAELNPTIGKLRVCDERRLLRVRGTVIRAGSAQMLEGERDYECNKCKHRFQARPLVELGYQVQLPPQCPSGRLRECHGSSFTEVEGTRVCSDHQELRVLEDSHALAAGCAPRSMAVILRDDLVDTVRPGDSVVVTGVLACKWKNLKPGARCDLEHVILANNIWSERDKAQSVALTPQLISEFHSFWAAHAHCPLKGRDAILKRICPQVYGLSLVKLAVALTLIGGVQREGSGGSRVRGDCHLLLVGDPGTGKSQFLKYAAKLSTRAVLTSGPGSSSAGLTATAVKEDGHWMLEAGALVLADGGLCCIDEFSRMKESDRAAIHEAMEQQSLSIAKAGLVTTLNTRASVFAVSNPKGKYDPNESLVVNTAIAGPLLSRFDIVMVLQDTHNPAWDAVVSAHILSEHGRQPEGEGGASDGAAHGPEGDGAENADGTAGKADSEPTWPLAMLQSYIRHVKDSLRPGISPEAQQVMNAYYQSQRRMAGGDSAARTTIRMLESLIRLAQAHARLMFRDQVHRVDAIAALVCVESSMTSSPLLDSLPDVMHSHFPDDPDAEYMLQEKVIMERLQLAYSPAPLPRPHLDLPGASAQPASPPLPTDKLSPVPNPDGVFQPLLPLDEART